MYIHITLCIHTILHINIINNMPGHIYKKNLIMTPSKERLLCFKHEFKR